MLKCTACLRVQLRAQKRLGTNYTLLASFTYSKTMDFGEFVFTLAHTVYLPFGRGRRYLASASRVVDAVLGGWQFNGITTVYSGLPFSPTLSNNASLNSDMSLRPNQIGDPLTSISQNRNLWFNPASYAVPAPFLFGTAANNSVRGPNLFTADWSLSKEFAITERFRLQFRWEVFNAFNRTNLALPVNAVDAGNAGQITDITVPMRNMQFGLRLGW